MALPVFEYAIVVFIGLVLGSFATALVWRVPRGIPWALAVDDGKRVVVRSGCPNCNKILSFKDLIPLFSWMALRGKCRYCGTPIGVRYVLIELATMLGCLGVYSVWGFTVPAFIIMAVVPVLMALFAIDAEHMILPNQLVLIGAGLALILILYQYLAYDPSYGFGRQALFKLAGMVVFGGIVWLLGWVTELVLKKEALGFGDVKFFAMAGLWLGLPYLPFFLILSGVLGVVLGIFYRIFVKKRLYPFGPALILALYTCLLLQGLEIVPFIGVQ